MLPRRRNIRVPSCGSGSSSSSSANTASSPLLKWQERLQVFLKAERLMRRLPDATSEDMGRCLKECDPTYTVAMWTAFYDEYSGSCGDYSAYRGNIFTPFISDALQEHILADALEGKRVILVDKDKMAKELWEKYGVYSLSHWKKHLSLMRDPSPIDEHGNDANASGCASPSAIPAKRRLIGHHPKPVSRPDTSPSVQQIQQIQQSDPVIYTVEDDSPPPSPKIRPKREPAKTQGSAECPPSFTKAELIEIFKSNEAWAPKIGDKSIKRVNERVFIEHLDRVHTDGAYFGYWLTMWTHYLKSEGIFK